jgi:lysyl-tRNA synthetase class 2
MHEESRRAKLQKIAELGHDPWGQRFDGHSPIANIRAREGEITTDPLPPDADPKQQAEQHGPKVRATGRIMLHRKQGKLIFLTIQDWSGRVQIFIGRKQVGEDGWALAECLDLGDLVGVDGELKRTKTGELTIFAERLHFHAKALEPPPEKHHGLADPELRQRMRYLDLAYSEGVLDRFLARTAIVQSIRGTLNGQGFVEVEGPTLHTIAGGAAARPFKTHHNALDIPLVLRIALELHLKRLLVGGIERVYELGRVYRNEGIDARHNPEFTMLEVYQAYGDYRSMMDLTEKIVLGALEAISALPTATVGGDSCRRTGAAELGDAREPLRRQESAPTGRGALTGGGYLLPWGDGTIDFTPPFARKTYDELFREHAGIDPADEAAVRRLADQIGFNTAGVDPDVIKSEVFEEKVEDQLKGPVFVMDYPAKLCPLTKRKRDNDRVAERFELFIQGMEVANAYTELNDPDLQDELFRTQLAGQKEEESMAKMDHDFIRALRQGMPPAGGLGIGIDRLVMLLTNSQTIRDVILFPLLRPEAPK